MVIRVKINKKGKLAADVVIVSAGTALYAAALTVFLQPSGISPGGVTGLAAIAGGLTSLPTGVLTALFNLPLLIWGWRQLGSRFVVGTAATTLLLSVWIDAFAAILPGYSGDRLLAALYGGFVGGVGLAMVFLRGSSTGGTDIAAKILARRFPRFSLGKVVLLLDGVIILLSVVVYKSFETGLYTALTIFISTKVIDSAVYGADRGKLALIVTADPQQVTQQIFDRLGRGVTLLSAHGGYSKSTTSLIMCAVRVWEVADLRKAATDADPAAFAVIVEAGEILGEGFNRGQN